jgi:hypothetical protein
MSEQQTVMTFRWSNLFAGTPVVILFWFGLAEGIVAIVQAAEWLSEYKWLYRLLPLVAFALSSIKLFIARETAGTQQKIVISADTDADLRVEKQGPVEPGQ